MSWFKELTSKAEAMLVNLDNNAAEAFQNPEGVITRALGSVDDSDLNSPRICDDTDKLDPISNDLNVNYTEPDHSYNFVNTDYHEDSRDREVGRTPIVAPGPMVSVSQASTPVMIAAAEDSNPEGSASGDTETGPSSVSRTPESRSVISMDKQKVTTDRFARKFTLQKTEKNLGPFHLSKSNSKKFKALNESANRKTIVKDSVIPKIGPDDIRASINQSLLEYSSRSEQVKRSLNSSSDETPGAHQSHFDQMPDLIIEQNYNPYDRSRSSHQPPSSFSIEFPDTSGLMGADLSPTSIKARLRRHKAPNRRHNPSLMQRMIYRLARSKGELRLFSNETRLSMSRFQLRFAGLIGQLNYYSRTYPRLRYLVLIYLVLMQILVIYVLFFYQSTGSATELSSQIKQQQLELTES